MSFSFKLIRKLPPAKTQLTIIKNEVVKQVQPVLRQYISQREQITQRFSNKPEYATRFYIRETGILITTYLKNARQLVKGTNVTIATLMDWLFKTGTKAHEIRAKRAKFLAFRSGSYNRKSEGGNGLSPNGEVVFRQRVNHPGFKPSKRLDNIDKRLEPQLKAAIDRGGRIGLNRAKNG